MFSKMIRYVGVQLSLLLGLGLVVACGTPASELTSFVGASSSGAPTVVPVPTVAHDTNNVTDPTSLSQMPPTTVEQTSIGASYPEIVPTAPLPTSETTVEEITSGVSEPDPEPSVDTSSEPPPALDVGVPVQVQPGTVAIMLDALSYRQGAGISVTIANGLADAIYAADMKTDCSIVILEHWADERWEPLLTCGMERSPLTIVLEPGKGQTVLLKPNGSNQGDALSATSSTFAPGEYRVSFTYRTTPGREGIESMVVTSAPFSILP